MNILICGASGLVGGNCLRYFNAKGENCVGTHFSFPTEETVYFNTLNIEDSKNEIPESFIPDVVLHCGALTHVDYCEEHEEESYEKTVRSTQNLLELNQKWNAKFIYISTDYVFDGLCGPYTEEDQVNPLSIYARHKLEAETRVRKQAPDHLILRITNVYGDEERNKNFVSRIIEQCEENKELNLTLPMDQFATPVLAWDIARALYLLIRDGKKGTYHIASTDWMNRVQLALNVMKYFPKVSYDLTARTTLELNQTAPRPLKGGLFNQKFAGEYPDFRFHTLDDYMRRNFME